MRTANRMKVLLKRLLRGLLRRVSPSWRKVEQLEGWVEEQIDNTPDTVSHLYLHTSQLFELGKEMGTHEGERTPMITVSLTTIPERIATVHLVIESLLRQSIKPDRIVLWLEKENFPDSAIPHALRRQEERGLTIKRCENLRSYKKLIPALEAFPADIIVTGDDDVFYPRTWLERLVQAWEADHGAIPCHRAHRIRLDGKGNIRPYLEWDLEVIAPNERSHLLFPTGVGGVLHFPGCFGSDGEVLKHDQFTQLAPTADDVWFKAMALRAGVPTRLVKEQATLHRGRVWDDIFGIPGTQTSSLWETNKHKAGNDRQIRAVFTEYDLYPLLRGAS